MPSNLSDMQCQHKYCSFSLQFCYYVSHVYVLSENDNIFRNWLLHYTTRHVNHSQCCTKYCEMTDLLTSLPTAREGNVFRDVCQSFCSQSALMATRSLLKLVTARSVRILLECFLVLSVITGFKKNGEIPSRFVWP